MKIYLSVVLTIFLLVTGCSSTAGESAKITPAAKSTAPVGSSVPATDRLRPVQATSELVVGPNRFVFGLLDPQTGAPSQDAPQQVDVQFFKVDANGRGTKVGDAQALYHNEGLPAGVFVARTEFREAGTWGALFTIRPKTGAAYQVPLTFNVVADSPTPKLGQVAPPSQNLTQADVKDITEICSAAPPDMMHDLTIAEGAKSGRPTLVLFATPGYCETATCGPDLQVAQELQRKYQAAANFIHIETPSSPAAPQAQAPTMEQWGLQTEPWIFLIDKDGKIADRFEGGLTLAEVEPAFRKLLSQ